MCELIDAVFDWLIKLTGNIDIVVLLLAVFPMAEARIAIPIAIKYAVPPVKAFLLGFLGSTAAAALLLLFLLPLLRLLSRLKPFSKLAAAVLTKAESKAGKIGGKNLIGKDVNGTDSGGITGGNSGGIKSANKSKNQNFKKESIIDTPKNGDLKKMLGVGAFVSLPLPLTGVWTGSLIAGVLELKYVKAFLCIATGNFLTSLIITVTAVYFSEYINIMVAVLTFIALFTVAVLLIKAFIPKRSKKAGRS